MALFLNMYISYIPVVIMGVARNYLRWGADNRGADRDARSVEGVPLPSRLGGAEPRPKTSSGVFRA